MDLEQLESELEGELKWDTLHKSIYATDASVYRKIPLAVAFPKSKADLKHLISFASQNQVTLIPRTAGTSLAGQCVGDGIVVDCSKHFTQITTVNAADKTVTLEPGVIRDDLNRYLEEWKLFFGPNTSTSNRCMMGGMVGNNSSGSTSIKYGVTRDKVVQMEVILSDGSEAIFGELSTAEFLKKTQLDNLEGDIYKLLHRELSQTEVQTEIKEQFPNPKIHRRNNGYAIDTLLGFKLFGGEEDQVNVAQLLCGSEGTLAFTTSITLRLDDVMPEESVMICAHFNSVDESLKAVVNVMNHDLYTCELLDKTILDCTKSNRTQHANRFFIKGDPAAVLMLELRSNDKKELEQQAATLVTELNSSGFGYHHAILYGEEIDKALELRKAGLGLLGNIIGDKKTVACIEDTAVEVKDLPAYIEEFSQLMRKFGQKAVYYAHAGAGELHLRPILNLKKSEDVTLFRAITTETAHLVKKYGGSFSGEHGDGIVRAEFIPLMVGEKNYDLLCNIKNVFDPRNVFNQGKIVNAFPMDESFRYQPERTEPEIKTLLDFSDNEGILKLAEKCNGSGDCRKSAEAGGTMCPSYRATKNEKDTTRARANALREVLTHSDQANKFDSEELKEVFDLCLSCKACATECPSSVDVSALKAEFLYQYQEKNGYSFRNKLFANNAKYTKLGAKFPAISNALLKSSLVKNIMGIAKERSIPSISKSTFKKWIGQRRSRTSDRALYLFCDEFTNFYDVQVGIDAVELLETLGYEVKFLNHEESGRSQISKGFLKVAKALANKNVHVFKGKVSAETPLIGLEPSAILTFKDEYLRLAEEKKSAQKIAEHTYTIEEFLAQEFNRGHIQSASFTSEKASVKIHGHCHQKALSSTSDTFTILNMPQNYNVAIMATGCCGMAGSFGYETEHYEVSMQVGENSLFPKVRDLDDDTIIAAAGTSCRHQIFDGTKRMAKHPVSVLREALKF